MIGKDAFEFLSRQAVEAESKLVTQDREPADVYFLKNPDGSFTRMMAEPKPRRYAAARLDDFVMLIKGLVGAGRHPKAEQILQPGEVAEPCVEYTQGPALVMVGEKGVTALLNEHERRERINFYLTTTMAFDTLVKLEGNRRPKLQPEFVSMLRIDLNECVEDTLVAQFKSIRFERNSEGESQISNSNKAVSTKVRMSLVAGDKDIPDSIDVHVCVYEEFPEIEMTVKCAVEANIEEATFTMIPLAGELHQAGVETRRRILDTLNAAITKADISGIQSCCGEINC